MVSSIWRILSNVDVHGFASAVRIEQRRLARLKYPSKARKSAAINLVQSAINWRANNAHCS